MTCLLGIAVMLFKWCKVGFGFSAFRNFSCLVTFGLLDLVFVYYI